MNDGRQTKTDEMVLLYEALARAVGEETADRLFPSTWRDLRRIRSREKDRSYIEHKAQSTLRGPHEPS